ncbi:MAG: hypothetical protein AAF550_06925 [Myxococcota bacterium]
MLGMRLPSLRWMLWTALASAFFALCAQPIAIADEPVVGAQAGQRPECAKVRHHAPYRGYGFHHIVEVENQCRKDLSCRITTNTNPEPEQLEVPKGTARSVTMFAGSPASEFQSTVHCN